MERNVWQFEGRVDILNLLICLFILEGSMTVGSSFMVFSLESFLSVERDDEK